jgi:hypothetical protein
MTNRVNEITIGQTPVVISFKGDEDYGKDNVA